MYNLTGITFFLVLKFCINTYLITEFGKHHWNIWKYELQHYKHTVVTEVRGSKIKQYFFAVKINCKINYSEDKLQEKILNEQ